VLSGINHLKNALGSCCGHAPGNYKLKLLATGKAKSHDLSGDPKQTAVLPIVATRKYGQLGKFLKISFAIFCSRSSRFPESKRITAENSVGTRQCPISSKRETSDNGFIVTKFLPVIITAVI
jgi:hypothetical protein